MTVRYIFRLNALDEPIEIQLPEMLRSLRVYNGLKQHEVAKELRISRSSYAYYEIGKTRPSLESLVHMARMYDVSVDFLLGNTKKTAAEVTAAVFASTQVMMDIH